MKHKATLRSALCVLLALLPACAPPQAGELKDGTICRHPAAESVFWEAGPAALLSSGDLRGADLRDTDLTGRTEALFSADFDSNTQWPEDLPGDFDPAALLELGKDPGLGLRALHQRGITGKGVGVAVIDQTLLVEHREYQDRVRLYQEYHSAAGDPASTHGPAVASIALGETVGVAPEALLYYIADDLGSGGAASRDLTHYAEDVERFVGLNETLPEGEKIRVISMSVGWMPEDQGAAELEASIARARAAGIAVVCVNSRDPLLEPWMGMGRTPYGDPNHLEDCRPGAFWEEVLYSGEYRGADGSLLLTPMDRRTMASPAGMEAYACFAEGGMSWVVPYVAGLYALACQVKPEVTFEEFLAAAQATARAVSVRRDETEYLCGKAVDPAALLEELQ